MYEENDGTGMLTGFCITAGLVCLGVGWWLFRKFRDKRPENEQYFRHFDLGPRGLFAMGGILLMLFGGALVLVGICLPMILR